VRFDVPLFRRKFLLDYYFASFLDYDIVIGSAAHINARMGPDLSAEVRQAIREKLALANVRVAAFGVTGMPADETQARKLFDFARDMGIEALVTEPPADRFDMIRKLRAS